MVNTRPTMTKSPAMSTITLMMVEASPVTVMQPAIMPAMAHATATGMTFLVPAANASTVVNRAILPVCASTAKKPSPSARSRQLFIRKLTKPMRKAPKMEMAALTAMVRVPEATNHTSSTSGRMR